MPTIKRITADDFGAHLGKQFLAMQFFVEVDDEDVPVRILAAACLEYLEPVEAAVEAMQPVAAISDAEFVGEDHPKYEEWRAEVLNGDTLLGLADWIEAGQLLDEPQS